MTPLCTSGIGSLHPPSFIAQTQASFRSLTLLRVISVSGLWFHA